MEDNQYKPTNRNRTQRPKGKTYYCNCDVDGVWDGQKCSCGRQEKSKRFKPKFYSGDEYL